MPKGILDMIMMLDAKKIIYTALRNHNAALEYNMHMIGICFTRDFSGLTMIFQLLPGWFSDPKFFSRGILDMR